ncbi:hypothetical protein N8703_04730 [Verrucomicrobia bacterium]|nr:hypothetical protein [Verrucomicrobiota bacterium]
MSFRIIMLACMPLVLWMGCATPATRYQPAWTGDALSDGLHAVDHAPSHDRVLWQMNTARVAMMKKKYALAQNLFDEVLLSIESRYGKDPQARKARGIFREEAGKYFIGEPYERVMAFYYRGILYWRAGEIDNARACFRSAQMHDSGAHDDAYSNDYVLMDYLDGLASHTLHASGNSNYLRATNSARLAVPPAYQAGHNVLFFADYGRGPSKFATGEYAEQLRIRPGDSRAFEMKITTKHGGLHLGPYDNVSYQATTRGGRVMDHILAKQAVFKTTTDTVGDAALISGLILSDGKNTQDIGLGLAAVGLVSKIISAATMPAADTRSWDNLPQFLTFGSMRLPVGVHTLDIEYLDVSGDVIPAMTRRETIEVHSSSKDTVVYLSDTQ